MNETVLLIIIPVAGLLVGYLIGRILGRILKQPRFKAITVSVAKLELQPGDTVLVWVPNAISRQEMERLRDVLVLTGIAPANRIVVLNEDVMIRILPGGLVEPAAAPPVTGMVATRGGQAEVGG